MRLGRQRQVWQNILDKQQYPRLRPLSCNRMDASAPSDRWYSLLSDYALAHVQCSELRTTSDFCEFIETTPLVHYTFYNQVVNYAHVMMSAI